MRVFDLLIPLLILFGAFWYYSNKFMAMRKAQRKLVTAYFTGGPMNGMERKMEECPDQYTFLYSKTVLVQETSGEPVQDKQKVPMVAIYHLNDTDYVYQGSASPDDVAEITEKDLLKVVKT